MGSSAPYHSDRLRTVVQIRASRGGLRAAVSKTPSPEVCLIGLQGACRATTPSATPVSSGVVGTEKDDAVSGCRKAVRVL